MTTPVGLERPLVSITDRRCACEPFVHDDGGFRNMPIFRQLQTTSQRLDGRGQRTMRGSLARRGGRNKRNEMYGSMKYTSVSGAPSVLTLLLLLHRISARLTS
jgi:hypothetical protein